MLLQTEKEMNEPVLPRKGKAPSRYEDSTSVGYHPGYPKEYFRQNYCECIDSRQATCQIFNYSYLCENLWRLIERFLVPLVRLWRI